MCPTRLGWLPFSYPAMKFGQVPQFSGHFWFIKVQLCLKINLKLNSDFIFYPPLSFGLRNLKYRVRLNLSFCSFLLSLLIWVLEEEKARITLVILFLLVVVHSLVNGSHGWGLKAESLLGPVFAFFGWTCEGPHCTDRWCGRPGPRLLSPIHLSPHH